MSGLDKAITAAGGKRRLALALNIKPSSLSRWIHKYQGQVPPKRVIQVYEVTGITPHELRPDLHPNPTSGLPENDTAAVQKESD
ncbi:MULTISPECIES: transcriptional regulator [Raoultella]|uniref:YdaS family helix-turn-helix protein n=1 Tax=Raoultella ornithinolytica TaxID=54291 RepID=A0ABZ2DU19_RAOOR|nr:MULTISPECIES: YdaS family helix-turn-helix protein [Raoultella]MBE0015270.1 helix-turn-helix domain-containing protein [Raoultella planticola]MDV1092556.1 YdaS family helix-turn-helix protein [Raoultella ornithinolytica]MDV1119593.1 YdaS family helix-turn-helix protein [Raoultella ornithinolytica]MDV1889957.1 YdaS family helix-turn-helix protein [Raoultella ornithinolytica]MEB8016365.1 helix-turn-helix domain-containing protein [Raoultella ornithinolytica]